MTSISCRAVPNQSRSQQTLDLIVDTAAGLFVEVGYEKTTTNAIAERAGLSIGALYRYFPDKEAILRSIVKRYYKEEECLFKTNFVEDVKYLPPALMIDRLFDPMLELHASWPAYAHILLGSDVSADIAAASCGSESEIIERLGSFFRTIAPHLDKEQSSYIAVICKATLKSLISVLVGTEDKSLHPRLTAEFKKMLLAYLHPLLWPDINSHPS